MKTAAIYVGEEHSRYVGQVYQENYARLRRYFLAHLGDATAADDCVRETVRRFFLFMEDRCWETHAEDVPNYLLRIAGGLLFSEGLVGNKRRRARKPGVKEALSQLKKIGVGAVRSAAGHINLMGLFRWAEAPTVGRASSASPV